MHFSPKKHYLCKNKTEQKQQDSYEIKNIRLV